MPAEAHALLSASSSHRWLHCPPSVRLSENMADHSSKYAEAGRLAHSIAELKARKYFIEPMSQKDYLSRMKAFKDDIRYEKDMDENTDVYLDHLKALAMGYGTAAPFVALEVRVDYSRWAREAFGTADCIIIGGDRMCVVDYKNGSGVPVEAEENSQMKLYALGALDTYRPIFGDSIHAVHLSIVQPNAGGIKEWDTTVEELLDWGEKVVKPAAALAWAGQGDYCPGPWCESSFCPAKARCTARARKLLEAEAAIGKAPKAWLEGTQKQKDAAQYAEEKGHGLLTDEELGDILQRAMGLEAWIKSMKEYALSAILAGRAIPGFKAVNGKSSREWNGGPDEAFAKLKERGVDEALLWNREPVTVPALEKALGKKAFTEAAKELWTKKDGSPSLALASDKRKEYVPAKTSFSPVTVGVENTNTTA